MTTHVNPDQTKEAPTFSKAQFLVSKQFTAIERDILRTLLKDEDGRSYTIEQAKKVLGEFYKRTVK